MKIRFETEYHYTGNIHLIEILGMSEDSKHILSLGTDINGLKDFSTPCIIFNSSTPFEIKNPEVIITGNKYKFKMNYTKIRESLAAIQHAIWGHWMKYMFTQGEDNKDGSWTMPSDKVERWKRQANTDYDDLTEKEKESDRHQADKFKHLIK